MKKNDSFFTYYFDYKLNLMGNSSTKRKYDHIIHFEIDEMCDKTLPCSATKIIVKVVKS